MADEEQDVMVASRLGDDEWWDIFGKMDPEDESTTPAEVKSLREYIEGHTSPSVAARRLMSIEDNYEIMYKGERISWFIWDVGLRFIERQPAILDLVDAIRAIPEQEQEQSDRQEERWEGSDLSDYDIICLETYDRRWETRYPLDKSDPSGSSSWVAASTLIANQTIRKNDCHFELHQRGFMTIATTLEQDPWNHVPPAWNEEGRKTKSMRDPRYFEYSITMLNTNVLGLVPWFLIAGHLIYNYDDHGSSSMLGGRMRRQHLHVPDADLWHGEPLFSLERWAFWKERLNWIAQQESLLENTRSTCLEVVAHMNEIEEDPQTERWKNWVYQ